MRENAAKGMRKDHRKVIELGNNVLQPQSFEEPESNGAESQSDKYNKYLTGMKLAVRQSVAKASRLEMLSPRERRRQRVIKLVPNEDGDSSLSKARCVSTIASMVPDEIIMRHSDHSVRRYETALMFIDVSGFTDLCETYTRAGRGGPSRLSQVLNTYMGAMVQEILAHDGDILKFSGDALISMWKTSPTLTMHNIVHTAIDCGLSIQKNYGIYHTDVGVSLQVKVSISAGISHFSIIGGVTQSHYVIVGQPVWDVKIAGYVSGAGDVLTSASAWMYVNEAEYLTQPSGDGRHTKVLGVGVSWKRVEKKNDYALETDRDKDVLNYHTSSPSNDDDAVRYYREYALRPAVVSAIRSDWWPSLRRFMVKPVLRAVDNDEPLEFLAEVRRVVIMFINIVTKSSSEELLINIVDTAYKCVCSVCSASGGLVNKVSLFDKDMMFLVIFGLRGLKHEDEAQKALLCALTLKENLNDPNITSLSIGVTSGSTYCGVVGHVLRREYTVIGSAVNKAARLMVVYPNKVTCDKETFLRSKLDQEFFRLVEPKPLKGFLKPGPIYEFSKTIWHEGSISWRHPILGRNEELRRFEMTLDNAIKQQRLSFTRYRDHVFGIAIIGPETVGKTRLMDECINLSSRTTQVAKIVLTAKDRLEYGLFRQIAMKTIAGSSQLSVRDMCENKIRTRCVKGRRKMKLASNLILRLPLTTNVCLISAKFISCRNKSLDITEMTRNQIFALNTIFGCRFPLPENFTYEGDLLGDQVTRNLISEIFQKNISTLWVVAIEDAINIDDQSWRLLIILMAAKTIFVIMNICDETNMSDVANECLSNNMILKMRLEGIERWYHAALACQLLDVQAIPADLVKVIQSASGGMPGWIRNFVISLIQRGVLSVVSVSRREALLAGAVMPPPQLLQADVDIPPADSDILKTVESSYSSMDRTDYLGHESGSIQMAVLAESYNFEDINVDMTTDAIILKTYDSLSPYEKMLLKCGSVIGEVFSRRMLQHLMQNDSPRKVAQAVAKLFSIRVLGCEGGDFSRDTSLVLVHPVPSSTNNNQLCSCIGIKRLPDCRDLPMYAFCGYMKFQNTVFRTTTYEMLTESQKHEMHARALLYLERYTRRCLACGSGCYNRLLGERCHDGLIKDTPEVRETQRMIRAMAEETSMPGENLDRSTIAAMIFDSQLELQYKYNMLQRPESIANLTENEEIARIRDSAASYSKNSKHVRSFHTSTSCECVPIILSVYCQIIDHCRGAGEYDKLLEAYLEYADLCVMNWNVPQAIRLLFEVEAFVMGDKYCSKNVCKISWYKDFCLARIYSLRGACMLESGDLIEARKHLFHALELYYDPFPTSKYSVKMQNMQASMWQFMALYITPKFNTRTESGRGLVGFFYDEIAETFNRLYKLFTESKEETNAALAAKRCLGYALKTNSNLRLLCESYGNLITIYRDEQKYSMCITLEKQAMELCNRKRGPLDAFEVRSVCFLYSSIFFFYLNYGKKHEGLQYGLSVVHMITRLTNFGTRQALILWMIMLLFCDLRLPDVVVLMREFFYLTDYCDLSSITWYHFCSMVMLLDTGYCVESYETCEKFYITKGDAILRSKSPHAAWSFFMVMWLTNIRTGAWEQAIFWEDKIQTIRNISHKNHEISSVLLIRLVEGLLIMLVREIDNRNIRKITILQKSVKSIFQDLNAACIHAPMYRPRYFLLLAYSHIIRGRKFHAFRLLNKSLEAAKNFEHDIITIWAEHTQKHWKGILDPAAENYWVEHVEPGNLLDYRDFNQSQGSQIIPFTLPLPRDLER